MIQEIAKKIVKTCMNAGIINEDPEVYVYGSELVISSFLGIFLSLLSGLLFGNFLETLLFLILFILLRRYTGGYHAQTHFNCILGTNLLSVLLNIIIHMRFSIKNILFLAILNGIIIFFLCPIPNRLIHSIHPKSYYKVQSIKFVIAYLLIAIISLYHLPSFTLTLSHVINTVSLLIILEVIKNEKIKNNTLG